MAFFSRNFINEPTTASSSSSYAPLFRFLDDFDRHQEQLGRKEHPAQQPQPQPSHHNHHKQHTIAATTMATFAPRFDVIETQDAYELHGELPGIDRSNVEIEFTDSQTIQIKGRVERNYHSSSSSPSSSADAPALPHGSGARSPTVEDDNEEDATASSTAVADTKNTHNAVQPHQPLAAVAAPKVWKSERNVGAFQRLFTFPARIDQDGVRAVMRDGVLSIVVPKMTKRESRRVEIS